MHDQLTLMILQYLNELI